MAEKMRIPAIRFRGFCDEWEVHELLSGATKIGDGLHGTPKYVDNGGVFFINGNNLFSGKINITDETKQVSVIEQSKNDKALDTNTILMSINGTIGNLAYYQGEEVMLGKSVAYISLSNFNKTYIYFYLQTARVLNNFNNSLTGSTIKNLGLKAIRETDVFIPENKTEQTQIGSYFQNLDKLISLHQAKYNKLVNLKKAMLEKMFPKQGADVPEIRFKGFEGVWEERKLLDNIEKVIDFRGRTPKKIGLDWSETGYLALSALNVKSGYIDKKLDAHYGNQELYDKWMLGNELHINQVLFTTEAPMGNVAQIPDNNRYILSQRTIAFEVKPQLITEDFLAVVLSSDLMFRKLSQLSSGGTAKGVSQKSLSSLDLLSPTDINEQDKIGSYFKNLDKLITLHQSELNKLNNLKKACLAKMFV